MPLLPTTHPRIYQDGDTLFSPNLVPGTSLYGERLVREGGREFRAWSPRRSKLAALLLLHAFPLPIAEDASLLYLGAGTGTTASHLSDLVPRGAVYAVEVAPRPFEKLLRLAEGRANIVPLMGDAREPGGYRDLLGGVELLYQDVAQRDQTAILLRNLPILREGGLAILMVKARSVDVTAAPETIFERARKELEAVGLLVDRVVPLSPYQKDHAALLLRSPGQIR
ncbi:MAG: fibrillarin-like rRNA/tRNA 2'-O-methyltransferase [Thermoplasmata archaeon]